jgi:hypothetical protein
VREGFRTDAVRSHHEIVVAGRAVAEADLDTGIVLGQSCERDTQSMWYSGSAGEQSLLQLDPRNAETRAYFPPEVSQIRLAEQLP